MFLLKMYLKYIGKMSYKEAIKLDQKIIVCDLIKYFIEYTLYACMSNIFTQKLVS